MMVKWDNTMTNPIFLKDDVPAWDVVKSDTLKKRDTEHGKIYVDTSTGDINFIQRWKYRFLQDEIWSPHHQKASAWTDQEELDFHYAAVCLIWSYWNSHPTLNTGTSDALLNNIASLLNADSAHLKVTVSGSGDFAKRFFGKDLFINFDVVISVTRPHYNVTVRKMLPGRQNAFRSNVTGIWLNLAKTDIEKVSVAQIGPGGATSNDFYTTPHEFGHTVGYDTDEYQRFAARRSDVQSIMNIGKQIRPRHFAFIIQQLNAMFPRTTFLIT